MKRKKDGLFDRDRPKCRGVSYTFTAVCITRAYPERANANSRIESYLVKILTSLAAILQGIAPLLTVTLSPPMLLCSTVPFGRLLRFGTLTLCGPQPLLIHTTASSPFLERWMRPLCGIELTNIGVQRVGRVEAVEQIFPIELIITAGEALLCAVIHNRNAANSKGETKRSFKLRPFIPVGARSSSGVA